jgi:hypothetical protein
MYIEKSKKKFSMKKKHEPQQPIEMLDLSPSDSNAASFEENDEPIKETDKDKNEKNKKQQKENAKEDPDKEKSDSLSQEVGNGILCLCGLCGEVVGPGLLAGLLVLLLVKGGHSAYKMQTGYYAKKQEKLKMKALNKLKKGQNASTLENDSNNPQEKADQAKENNSDHLEQNNNFSSTKQQGNGNTHHPSLHSNPHSVKEASWYETGNSIKQPYAKVPQPPMKESTSMQETTDHNLGH